MKLTQHMWIYALCAAALALGGCCCRTQDDVWDDTKTCGRYISRGVRTLIGNRSDSRMICRPEEFGGPEGFQPSESSLNAWETEYVPIPDQPCNDEIAMADMAAPQPKESPGDPGSTVPGIDAFKDPHTVPGLAGIFRNVQFEYNSNLVKGQENLDTLHRISDYMRKHPDAYVFVEGHCDERGAEAYNLALGARRANAVRSALIKEGVNPDNIFTISYGKERPLVLDHHEEAWSANRRAEFKVYQR